MTAGPGMLLLERLHQHARDAADRVAVREVGSGRTITFAELRDAVRAFAGKLGAAVPAGTACILRSCNAAEFHIGFLGALSAGMAVFPVSTELTDVELAAAIRKSSAGAVIDQQLEIRRLTSAVEWFEPGLLLQSSGTTGLPRIAFRAVRSLDAVSSNMVNGLGLGDSDRVLSCVPLCHSYGLEHGLLAPLFAGATVHLINGFDLAAVQQELVDAAITAFPGVPSIYEMLGHLPHPERRFPALRLAYSAGGSLPESVFERVRREYGMSVGQLFGATEIGSVSFSHPASDHFDPRSVGRAFDGVELKVDADNQLLVRATSMMGRYIGDDDDSPLTADGFFPTGDIARIDGRRNLFITGRLKFLIEIGGLKVNPMEVEQAIAEHPLVTACVVVPMRVSETIARLKAIVTPADPAHPPTAMELRQFARGRLSPYKVPRLFEIRSALPRSATGKVLRHLLVEST